ncbi:flavin reductase family protein [Polaromonas sp. JS666]|uniref:flavin reductase family protein n=1 Tax=Polaromonas sp. (strain JS666 / ATCC BAA-500) TaxID=296591 RepID=UPI00005383D7|nr:flavin reductase family protein [Polaromonas sp. JS666]ABE43989.1 resorcinol 4-hydroxylase reductase subunit [Polaromonas sp. JS666]
MKTPTVVAEVQTAFRDAMRGIASTVSIVTAGDRSRGHGMTATAITSVSLDPPALLVCINRKTLLHDIISSTGRFCVNVLAQQHREISNAFSGGVAPHERFSMGDWSETEDGLKYLTSAQARIFCVKKLAIPFGTHTIFVGEVGDVQIAENSAPLLYQNSTYCSSTPVAAQ